MKKTRHDSLFIVVLANLDGTIDIDYEYFNVVQIEALPHVDGKGNFAFLAEIIRKGKE